MHGDSLSVSYVVLNSGNHRLVVQVRRVLGDKKTVFEEAQTVDLKIAPKEHLSSSMSFRCFDDKNRYVYGVISEKKAKEFIAFKPERAWLVDQVNLKLSPVEKLNSVSCKWHQEGESKYPFK